MLATTVIEGTGPSPRELWILHGILGSGRNWRTFGRGLAAASGWRVVLVDLRAHGSSPVGAPPHTVEACARDLVELAAARGGGPEVLVGHSFGGKVALLATEHLGAPLRSAWVLDAVPGPVAADGGGDVDAEVAAVIRAVGGLPMPVAGRDDVREHLVSRGFSPTLAAWMTTNLRPADDSGGYVWRFDLDAVRALIADYAALDLWPVAASPRVDVHVVRAGRSDRWTPAVLRRLDEVAAGPRGHAHVLADAGHWLHVDAPGPLQDLLLADLVG